MEWFVTERTVYSKIADDVLILLQSVTATEWVPTQLKEAALNTGLVTNLSKTK